MLLDVSALDQVLDHAAGDLIVATQAGARLADVQQAVGQRRPAPRARRDRPRRQHRRHCSPPTPAVRAGSPTGTARDLLIGITVVRADGVVAKAGGRVVKNVAGYDLGKLMIGSLGTLARHHRGDVPAAPRARPRSGGSASRSTTRPQAQRLGAVRRCTRRPCPPRSRSTGPPTGAGTVSVLLEGRTRASRAGPRRSAPLLGEPSTESPTDAPAGGSTYPWDLRPPATTGPPRSS